MGTRHVLFGLFWTVCFFSALSIAGGLEMFTVPKVLATCGQNVTLTCNVTAAQKLDIKSFYWMEKKEICNFTGKSNETGINCSSAEVNNTYFFNIIISKVQPQHKGTYHCKLRAKEGVKNDQTILRVQKCFGDSKPNLTSTEATCIFKDVFPKPTVQWMQGSVNLTHLTKTNYTEDALGRFTVTSSVKLDLLKKEKYTCSLWMPTENANNETVNAMVKALAFSGGHMVIAHWICMMLTVLLVMLMI